MKKKLFNLSFIALLLISGCASLQQPQGGPRDVTPPKVLSEVPKNLSINFHAKKIDITFDEYFKLANEFTEITISPAIEILPTFKTKQKDLEITFKDSLEENTTYTINFGKAIQDVNESNVLKNYSFVFATGPTLDSLQISGKVINSADNKPVLDATVFIYPLNKDTLFGKKKPSLYTTSDSSGNFRIKNLREDVYTIYALKELSVDRIYNSANEEIAFLSNPIKLNKDTGNITLKLFKEVPEKFRILDRKIEADGKILIVANKPIIKPSISFLEADLGKDAIIDYSTKADSIQIWLKELTFDSLKVSVNSDNKPLDTLSFKRGKKDVYTRNILFSNNLSANKIRPATPLIITFNQPILNFDVNKIVLLEDSVSKMGKTLTKTPNSTRSYQINYPWITKKRYTLSFESGAIKDIYNTPNKPLKLDFELDEIENYGNFSLNVVREDSLKNYIVQLLTDKNILYKEFTVVNNTTLIYKNIPTGKFLVKVIEDANKNGSIDSGNVRLKIQPEKSWIWDKELVTRANWDREEKLIIPKDF